METENQTTSDLQENSNKTGVNVWSLILKIVAVFLIVLVGVGIAIYRFSWRGPVMEKIVNVLPYPAVVVNYRMVPLSDYFTRFEAFRKAVEYSEEFDFDAEENQQIIDDTKEGILKEMVRNSLVRQLAAKRGLSVSQVDLDQQAKVILAQTGNSEEGLRVTLANVYGWDWNDFEKFILSPQVIEGKLRLDLVTDEEVNGEQKSKAEEALSKIEGGSSFQQIAGEYSDDSSNNQIGGDLGWAGRGLFVEEFEDKIFAMSPDDGPMIVPSRFGYHIVEVLEKTGEGDAEQVHTRHILIGATDFDQWLNGQLEQASVWQFKVM